jgi:surface protein
MFYNCKRFNQPLKWNTEKVEDMSYMFFKCINFNQPLDNWNVSQVTNMSGMFEGCAKFNQTLNSWNTENVGDMSSMFEGCTNLYKKPFNDEQLMPEIYTLDMYKDCIILVKK